MAKLGNLAEFGKKNATQIMIFLSHYMWAENTKHLTLTNVAGDGNCFSSILTGSENSAYTIRQRICDTIVTHGYEPQPYFARTVFKWNRLQRTTWNARKCCIRWFPLNCCVDN